MSDKNDVDYELQLEEEIDDEIYFTVHQEPEINIIYNLQKKFWRAEIEDDEIEDDIIILEDEEENIEFGNQSIDLWGCVLFAPLFFKKIQLDILTYAKTITN